MSTSTRWIVNESVPDVVCFVDCNTDHVRARFVNENDIHTREAELTSRWKAAMSLLQYAQNLMQCILDNNGHMNAAVRESIADFCERDFCMR